MDAEIQAQFARMGVAVPLDEETGGDDAMPVWAENWDSLTAFLACETQWRAAVGLSNLVWLGLDYAGVEIVMRRRSLQPEAFDDIQFMERCALEAFNEERE